MFKLFKNLKILILLILLELSFTFKFIIMYFCRKNFNNRMLVFIKGHRKLVSSILLFLIFCIYLAYRILYVNLGFNPEYIKTSSLDECLNNRLENYKKKINEMDAVEYDKSTLKNYLFVGNGYIGMSQHSNKVMLLAINKSLSIESDFSPIIEWSVTNYFHNEKLVLDFLSGMFIRFQCYKQSSLCISVTYTSYAHRSKRELLIQELRIHNPTKVSIQIALKYNKMRSVNLKLEKVLKIKSINYEILSEQVFVSKDSVPGQPHQIYIAGFAKQILPDYINIPAGKDEIFQHISAVKYVGPLKNDNALLKNETELLCNSLKEIIIEARHTQYSKLRKEHEDAWHSLFETGITIDKSLAPNALNGYQINSTIYYLLSNFQSFLSYKNISDKEKKYYARFMNKGSHCYSGHDTLYATHLWTLVSNKSDLQNLINKWLIILHKFGCGLLIRSGAHGLIQAIVYSAGSFHFAGDHISFGMHPNDLQRRLHFRNLLYNGLSFSKFDVAVDLDEENRPQLWVSIKNKADTLYACDAGCVDSPIRLSQSMKLLPVKLTKPRYPILYISDQMSHIDDLKHIIHVSVIEDAKAHNHHIIALHKHGHSWGGLPPLFWFTIVLLVVVFHLFLCKVIYSEYCRYRDDYDLSMSDSSRTFDNHRVNYHYMPSTRRSQYYRTLN